MTAVRGLGFHAVDPAAIPTRSSKRPSVYAATIGEFMRSGLEAVEVETNGTGLHAVCGQLQKAIDRAGLRDMVVACERRGHVYVRRVR